MKKWDCWLRHENGYEFHAPGLQGVALYVLRSIGMHEQALLSRVRDDTKGLCVGTGDWDTQA